MTVHFPDALFTTISYTSCLFQTAVINERKINSRKGYDFNKLFKITKMSIKTGITSALTLLGTFISFYIVYALLTNQLFLLDIGWLLTAFGPIYWASLGRLQQEYHFTDLTGIGLAMGLSVMGAAWGIWSTGASVMGGGVIVPRIYSKNLVSIIFCEAVAIYGIIVSIIMATGLKPYNGDDPATLAKNFESGYRVFGAGMITGMK